MLGDMVLEIVSELIFQAFETRFVVSLFYH